ncbi:MAG TPA: hypothetical protein DCS43_16170, partial [Verrucomicrobia bacterium]|nr:hypothetical protein [Verrucomicrobiota bacterium]
MCGPLPAQGLPAIGIRRPYRGSQRLAKTAAVLGGLPECSFMTLSADNPYRLPPAQSDHPGNLRKQAYIEAEQVRRMAETPQRPANMAFFEQRLSRASTAPKSRPRIGYLCNLVPVEIMMAANADPVRLDNGNGAAAAAGEEILAGDICPLAKATLGVFLRENGLPRTCDAYVVPAACDAKRKLAEILSDFAPVFAMALPPDNDSAR